MEESHLIWYTKRSRLTGDKFKLKLFVTVDFSFKLLGKFIEGDPAMLVVTTCVCEKNIRLRIHLANLNLEFVYMKFGRW